MDLTTLPVFTFQNLRVYPFELERIIEIEIAQNVSQHSKLILKATIKEEFKDHYVAMTEFDTTIIVKAEGFGADSPILFQGITTRIDVDVLQGVYHLYVEAASFTYQLGLAKRSRSFQDKEMPLSEIVKNVISTFEDAEVHFRIDANQKLYQFLVQYQQSDWDFLVLLASIRHTGIIADPTSPAPKLFFGIPQNTPAVKMLEINYTIEKVVGENSADFRWDGMRYFTSYRVKSKMLLRLGQQVLFKGETLYVKSIVSKIEKGVLIHEYCLTEMSGLYQVRIYNDNLIGASIEAKVLDVKREKLKLHLAFDNFPDEAKNCWFEYASMYNSGVTSGVYMMPEIGDHVRLYFPGKHETECFVINSINRPISLPEKRDESEYGLERDRWKNHIVKSIKANGKEIILAPDRIIMQAADVSITWHDEEGVIITTKNNIKIRANEAIDISAAEVHVDGEEKVQITCGGSSIKLTPGGIKIGGPSIEID